MTLPHLAAGWFTHNGCFRAAIMASLYNMRHDFTAMFFITREKNSDVLGPLRFHRCKDARRRAFNIAGPEANDAAILHIMEVEKLPNPRKGVLDHMAFRGKDVNALLRKLKTADVTYRISRTPAPWDQWQIFFEDPNGAVVEVDFDGQETLAPENQSPPA